MGNILNIINSDKDFYDTHNGHYMRCRGLFIVVKLKENFKINEVNIDNIDENKTNYIYLVECVTQDAYIVVFLKYHRK